MYPFEQPIPVSQGYGKTPYSSSHPNIYPNGMHYGIDFAAPCGTKLFPIIAGEVVHAGTKGAYGNAIITSCIWEAQHVEVLYAHLSKISVGLGSIVNPVGLDDAMARTGNTGTSTACHLHLGVKVNGAWVDPTPWIGLKFDEDIFNELTMTKEQLLKELDARYAKKDVRINLDMKDGSVWIVNNNLRYKVGTASDDVAVVASYLAKEQLSEIERGYPITKKRIDVL